jgi:hypothetical protein
VTPRRRAPLATHRVCPETGPPRSTGSSREEAVNRRDRVAVLVCLAAVLGGAVAITTALSQGRPVSIVTSTARRGARR